MLFGFEFYSYIKLNWIELIFKHLVNENAKFWMPKKGIPITSRMFCIIYFFLLLHTLMYKFNIVLLLQSIKLIRERSTTNSIDLFTIWLAIEINIICKFFTFATFSIYFICLFNIHFTEFHLKTYQSI